MIDIRRWQFLLQEIEQGQQHGAQGPEEIRKGQIAVFFLIDPLYHIEEIAGHENAQNPLEPLPAAKDSVQFLDIEGLLAHHQVVEHAAFLSCEHIFLHAVGFEPQHLIKEFFLYPLQVFRELVLEMPPVLFLCPDGIDEELIFGHAVDKHLYPGRNATHHIRIGPFHQQANAHQAPSFQYSTDSGSVISMR